MFQSAPLTEARGDDDAVVVSVNDQGGFNPLPSPKQGETVYKLCPPYYYFCFNPLPSPKQGETRIALSPPRLSVRFNPLPSPKQGETSFLGAVRNNLTAFQSAPLTEARGDIEIEKDLSYLRCFNPLPSPKQGETGTPEEYRPPIDRFNPLPSPKQGETRRAVPPSALCWVSIRSPHRSKGRLGENVAGFLRLFVSIRSPHRSKGRHQTQARPSLR